MSSYLFLGGNMLGRLTIYSHHFVFHPLTPAGSVLIHDFAKQYVQKKMVSNGRGKYSYVPDRVYGCSNRSRSEFRFHINQLPDLYKKIGREGRHVSELEVTEVPMYEPVEMVSEFNDQINLRDYQVPASEFLTSADKIRMLSLKTGRGKGITSSHALSVLGYRVLVILKPGYISKWRKELEAYFPGSTSRSVVLEGSPSIIKTVKLLNDDALDVDFIIVSNRTLASYISYYEDNGIEDCVKNYGMTPDQFISGLRCGVKLIDEVHQDFHMSFKIDCYTHVPKQIALSATLKHKDSFIESMYRISYPLSDRYSEPGAPRHVNSVVMYYRIYERYRDRIRDTNRGSTMYNQIQYEESIITYREVMRDYLELIKYCIDNWFIRDYKPGEKCIVFVSSRAMVKEASAYLEKAYPDRDVKGYLKEDDYANLIESTIRVTTHQNGGTGHDIPGLKTAIQTISMDSAQGNDQAFGRLRPSSEFSTRYVIILNKDNNKHMRYQVGRKKMLDDEALTYVSYEHDVHLGRPTSMRR